MRKIKFDLNDEYQSVKLTMEKQYHLLENYDMYLLIPFSNQHNLLYKYVIDPYR
jgi:hypothetical protein